MIHTFGNSHVNFFTNSLPQNRNKTILDPFISYPLGPTIAYNFYEHYYAKVLDMLNTSIIDKKNDYVMLVVGEVDCRWHLPYQIHQQNKNYKDVIEECIDRFFRCHLDLKRLGYKVISWGGHPSTIDGHNDNPNCPIWGDCNYRNLISMYWSDYLEYKSKNNQIEFISIIKDLIYESNDDKNNIQYLTKMEYYIDYCHLNSNKYLNSVINKFNNLIS